MSIVMVAHAWKGRVGSMEGDDVGEVDGVDALGFHEGESTVGDIEGRGTGD